ncbi:MAG: helix-turn-helix transcriptional regulator [Proteobacteria bacterium]|nr:helix-turn-helix transcriptional regulator [Pseudomonadota bacterium]
MKDAGISQRELVRRSGVGRSALRRMFAGGDPTLSLVEKVLNALEHDLDAIPRAPTVDKTPVKNCKTVVPAKGTPHPQKQLSDRTVNAAVRSGNWSNVGCQ